MAVDDPGSGAGFAGTGRCWYHIQRYQPLDGTYHAMDCQHNRIRAGKEIWKKHYIRICFDRTTQHLRTHRERLEIYHCMGCQSERLSEAAVSGYFKHNAKRAPEKFGQPEKDA